MNPEQVTVAASLGDSNTSAWIDHAFDNRLLARRREQRDRDDDQD